MRQVSIIAVAWICLMNAVTAKQRQIFAEMDSPREVAALTKLPSKSETNDHELFQNEDILNEFVFPVSSVEDLGALYRVSRFLSNETKSLLIERKLEHEKAIESKIEEMEQRDFIICTNTSSHEMMIQFVHGFDQIIEWLMMKVFRADDNNGVHEIGIDEQERVWLKNHFYELRELTNDYAAKYNPIGQFLGRLDHASQSFGFMKLQREVVALTTRLGAFGEKIKEFVYEKVYEHLMLYFVLPTKENLKTLMELIGSKVGCPQVMQRWDVLI